MAQPIVLRFKSDTESARRAVVALGTTVATSMASVSAAAMAAHQSNNLSIGGIALTALKAAASLTAMQYAAVAAFAAFTAAAAAGAVELEKFQKLAEKAAASNLGTTFFQAFVDGARQLRLETKQLESDLAALEKATRDKFDADRASGVANRAGDLLQARFRGTNDFGLSESPALFANAQTAEERIRAVLVALRDMEGAGQRLAAIDLARQLGLDNLAERVEQGRASFSGFLAEVEKTAATGLRDGSLVSPELIARADELKRRWEANTEELSKNLRPILDECARLALAIGNGAAWTAEQFTKVVGVVGEAVRLMRQLASLVPGTTAGAIAATDAQSITALETRLRDAGLSPLQRRGLEQQLRDAQGRVARREASDVPEAPVDFSYGGTPAPATSFGAPVPNARPASAGTGSAASSGGSSAEKTDEWAAAYERLINAMEKSNEVLKAELATIGKSTVEKEKALAIAKAEAEARRTGGTLTDEQRQKILALAEAQGRLKDAIKAAEAAQKAYNDAVQFAGTLTSGFLSDIISGGKNAQEAVMNLVKKLADALLMAALLGQGPLAGILGLAPAAGSGSTVGGLFGMLGGGMGAAGMAGGGMAGGGLFGMLGGLFGMGAAAAPATLSPFMFFHAGGVLGTHGAPGSGPASLFSGAPRFHGGGGLRPDELPIIGQIGEEMLTRNQRSAVAQSLAMGDAAMQALQARSGGVTMANTYYFNNVTAADRATIIAEVERRDAEVAGRIVPTVQDADRHGIEVMPYSKGM